MTGDAGDCVVAVSGIPTGCHSDLEAFELSWLSLSWDGKDFEKLSESFRFNKWESSGYGF
jgi:hypothetical protein